MPRHAAFLVDDEGVRNAALPKALHVGFGCLAVAVDGHGVIHLVALLADERLDL